MLKMQFRIETAENGCQAVNLVEKNPLNYFQAIVLDLNMPVMNGFEAFKVIKDLLDQSDLVQKPQVYIMTADESAATKEALQKIGCTNVFH